MIALVSAVRDAGWTRRTICVPSRIFTLQASCVALLEAGGVKWKALPPGINARMSGGCGYNEEFQDTVWPEH